MDALNSFYTPGVTPLNQAVVIPTMIDLGGGMNAPVEIHTTFQDQGGIIHAINTDVHALVAPGGAHADPNPVPQQPPADVSYIS